MTGKKSVCNHINRETRVLSGIREKYESVHLDPKLLLVGQKSSLFDNCSIWSTWQKVTPRRPCPGRRHEEEKRRVFNYDLEQRVNIVIIITLQPSVATLSPR